MTFESRVRELSNAASLHVYSLTSRRAQLTFECERSSQTLWIYHFSDSIWEFSCVSAIAFNSPDSFPQAILAAVLMQNSQNKRGFWCIEQLGEKFALEFMQNLPEHLLTPNEFRTLSWSIVKQVDRLEQNIFG